jgi:carbon-monoxide dehydrogenase medium subunit
MEPVMGNTRILAQEFEYFEPETIQEAVRLLDQHGPEVKVIAGGTDLLVQIKQETVRPRCLVSVKKISELHQIVEDGSLRIGAGLLLREVMIFCSREDGKYAAVSEAIRSLGKVQVRNMGTIGGNLCNASPAADSAPPLLVLDASVKLSSSRSDRVLSLRDFLKGVNITAMASNEILTEIQIPEIPKGLGSAFLKIARVSADISKVSAAVAVGRKDNVCVSCKIALGAVAPVPMRAEGAEKLLIGKKVEADLVEEVGEKAAEEIRPVTDVRSTVEYRKQVAAVLVRDALWEAWLRTGGKRP